MIDLPPQFPPLPNKPVAQALADCGLINNGFTITYERDLQGNVVTISIRAGANRTNLQCIWNAAWTEFVQFDDKDLQVAYDEISRSRFEPIARQQARDALAKRGLLDGLPDRSKFSSLAEVGIAIEKHCGFAAHQALHVSDNMLIFDPGIGGSAPDQDKVACIFAALTASGQAQFGFIGNEQMPGH